MFALDPIQLWDIEGLGPHLLPVTQPGGIISPHAGKLAPKSMGKAPGCLTPEGWIPVSVLDTRYRCHDYNTAKTWQEWHANVGLVAEHGLAIYDNDVNAEFSDILAEAFRRIGVVPLRRYVDSPKHERDAFIFQVRDFVGEPVAANRELVFRKGLVTGRLQTLASHKQVVISGTHRDTLCPYVLDQRINSIDEIPVLSEEQFAVLDASILEACARLGWAPDVAPRSPVLQLGGVSVSLPPAVNAQPSSPEEIKSGIDEASKLLAHLPNREVPAGETPTPLDQWLDVYENWIKVAYALIAFLSPVANTSEAETLWLEWAHGRPQVQDPVGVWQSALRQPLRYGPIGLIKLLQGLGALPQAEFPDLPPQDLVRKTPLWDDIRDCYALLETGHFLNTETSVVRPRGAFNDYLSEHVPSLMNELGVAKPRGGKMTMADVFALQRDKRCFDGMTYAPGDPSFVQDERRFLFNLWKPADVSIGPVSAAQIKPWLDHVAVVVGKLEVDLFVKWCAFVAQFPGIKPNWHVLVISDQGLGKDTMVRPVRCAVGKHNSIDETIDYIVESQFNDYLKNKLLIVSEIGSSQTTIESRKASRRLKQLQAAPPYDFLVNTKHRARFLVPNRHAMILFSNESKPMLLERGQRRLYVINRLGVPSESKDYYANLSNWLDTHEELVAAYLLTLPLSDFDKANFKGRVPPNQDTSMLEEQSVDPRRHDLEVLIADIQLGVVEHSPLIEAQEVMRYLRDRGHPLTNSTHVNRWLLDMEQRGGDVGRVRVDPRHPTWCGVISYRPKGGQTHSRRLWHLTKDHQGRAWADFSDAELIALWEGKPLPSAAVLAFPPVNENDEKI